MLTAAYDLAVSPPTYDIVAFLCAVEKLRIERGEDRIALHILPGPADGFRRDNFWPHTARERQQMLDRVAIPMAGMLPSADVTVWCSRRPPMLANGIGVGQRMFGLNVHVESMRVGIRPLRLSHEVERDPKLVTITLREAEHWPGRNSNVKEWQKAAGVIQERGYRVLVLRDTLRADEPLAGQETAPAASRDLAARAALYRSAACNLFVNNGCAWFCLALDAPVLMLRPTTEGVQYACSAAYFERCGIPCGGQIPGAPDYQRLAWADDTADNILRAFEEYGNRSSQDRAA